MRRIRWMTLGIVVLAVLVALAAGPAPAKDPHDGDKAGAHQAGAHDEPKKKENPIAPEVLDLAIWTLVVFLLLLFLLTRFAWKPMLEGLRKREETIRGAVEEAKLARAETERARAEFGRQLAEAQAEIPKLLEAARRDAQALAEDMRTRATAEIQADRQRLRREIETARDQALKDIWDQAAQLATLISAKAIRRSLSPDDHRRLVDEALVELKQAQENR